MPKDLRDFPRPPSDNGRGLHGSLDATWTGGEEGFDYWLNLLAELNIKWFKVLDDGGSSIPLCEKLLAAGIFPIVRILRRDPPPNDTPEPNPGHLGGPEETTVRRLVDLGVRYFETNNEPNLSANWKTQAFPANLLEAAKLVALNWLFDARLILSMGAYPGLPAISSGADMDLIGALATLGRQNILLEGCWIALHNYCGNRPITYPDDPISRSGQPLTSEQYAQETPWVWWNNGHGQADTIDEINELRVNLANPAASVLHDHACFREFEYYNALAMKYLGRSIPIISTEGGYRVGRREDMRYPRITPGIHRDQTIALFDFMQRQAPDYYFAATPSFLIESAEHELDAWHSQFWQRAATNAPFGFDGIPNTLLTDPNMGEQLPVIDAVKALQNLARRMPGAQPVPPVQPAPLFEPKPVSPAPIRVPSPSVSELIKTEPTPAAQTEFPSWLRDEPLPKPILKPIEALQESVEPEKESIELAPPTPVSSRKQIVEEPVDESVPFPPPPLAITPSEEKHVEQVPMPPPPMPTVPSPQIAEPVVTKPIEKPKIDFAPPPPPEEFVHVETVSRKVEPRAPIVETQSLSAPLAVPDDIEWDWRLDALGVVVEPANVKPGQAYWKIVRAAYQAPNESNDGHQIIYNVIDQKNNPIEYQKVLQGWADGETDAITNENGETHIPMWLAFSPDRLEQGPYIAWIDGLASDHVRGMGLPSKRHVNFIFTWKRSVATFLDTERRR